MNDYVDKRILSLEILSSITNIETRINELQNIVATAPIVTMDERRKSVIDRITRLMNTKRQLVESFLFLNHKSAKDLDSLNPFDRINITADTLEAEFNLESDHEDG